MAEENLNKKALKAGIWFTICNFATRGISFITVPIFARMLTKADYGEFANYASWASLLTILTTLDLYASINNAKIDHKDDFDSYISSILVSGTFFTAICYAIVVLFQNFFTEFFGMNMIYIHSIFITLLFAPALTIYQTRNNALLEYKKVAIVSFVSTILSAITGILFVVYLEDKFAGRVAGTFVHALIIYIPIYIYLLHKNHSIKKEYIKYAFAISLPLIPHILAGNILGSSDRLMIKHFCGAEPTALYSLVYTCSTAITILLNSLNTAWVPWFFQKMKNEDFESINEVHKPYIMILAFGTVLFSLLGPEFVLLFGGQKYIQSVEIIPPIVLGCFCNCLYTLFVNIEFYYKKTILISSMTIVASLFNLITNYFFIPLYGYKIAAYTTLLSYILLLLLHFFACRQYKPEKYFSMRLIFSIFVIIASISFFVLYTYNYAILRFTLILITVTLFLSKLNKVKNTYYKKQK